MVKFKLRIFTSCQTKHSSTPPEHSSPPSQRHKSITCDSPCTTSPPPSKQTPHRCSFKSHISSAFRCGSQSGNQSGIKDFQSHVVAKLLDGVSPRSKTSNSAIAGVVSNNTHGFWFPLLPVPPFYGKKNRCPRKEIKTLHTDDEPDGPNNFTTSSARFSTVDGRAEILSNPRKSFSDVGIQSRSVGGEVSPEWGSPARLSVFKKLMPCKMEGKVKESFAVVKRSEKPYEDFKKSMMEMIVENQIYEENDLKQLLQCFLSLNSRYHHGVIMEAFLEIWNTMFLQG